MRDLRTNPDVVWSLLLFSGYLRAKAQRGTDFAGRPRWRVRIPNREVRLVYTGLFGGFLRRGLGREQRVNELCTALLRGDGETFGELLETLMLASLSLVNLSHHDVAKHQADERKPEAVYQAFFAGAAGDFGSHALGSQQPRGGAWPV